ncbi:MAG: MBL fold metallo-hydrolase [Bacteroidales bacterium]|nr:MBL fold metallo-hydrolase [Bacteroidales bacterium]
MDRRKFLSFSTISLIGCALMPSSILSACKKEDSSNPGKKGSEIEAATGHFSIMQVSSTSGTTIGGQKFSDNIGNSYIIKTSGGKVIVLDGGPEGDAPHLRSLLKNKYGGTVDQWWVSHPHSDHIGALLEILRQPQGITVKEVYHSRFPEGLGKLEQGTWNKYAVPLYDILDNSTTIKTTDLQSPGGLFEIDGIYIKVVGVTNPELTVNTEGTSPYNNSSMIIRVWDDSKSFLFLGDAQQECGDKLLTKNSRFYKYLTADYVQVAHHGQQGVKESFYKSITFKKCLWPTPEWVFNPKLSSLQTENTKRWLRNKGVAEDCWIVSCLEKDWYLE